MPIVKFQWRKNTSVEWADLNPVLLAGEPGYILDTGNYKLGDGRSRWLDLPEFTPGGGGPISSVDLEAVRVLIQEHVDDQSPHPAYDDMPSLVLLYQNAKV